MQRAPLFEPLQLPCGVTLSNRIAKSAMSDSLGDGTGHPTAQQMRLYQRWAAGGLALSIIGEVQLTADYAENPGNLVLNEASDLERFRELARHGGENGAQLWLQLGHAGALAYAPTSRPKGPSAFDLPGLRCMEITRDEIRQLPEQFARTARLAQRAGFGGVQIHAAHGFLLGQFLSPLFNKRSDEYGGAIANRVRPLLEAVAATRAAVGPNFPIAVKLNSSDELEGGFDEEDALKVVAALDGSSIDLIDISGGTYFPGAKSASDRAGRGPYFLVCEARPHCHDQAPHADGRFQNARAGRRRRGEWCSRYCRSCACARAGAFTSRPLEGGPKTRAVLSQIFRRAGGRDHRVVHDAACRDWRRQGNAGFRRARTGNPQIRSGQQISDRSLAASFLY